MNQPLGNVRGLLLSSIVGASLLFTGCGSSSGSTDDTQNENPVDSTVQTVQVESLVGTLDCLLGLEEAGLGLGSADLDALSGAEVTPEALLGALQSLPGEVSTVEDLLAVPMTLDDALALLQSSVPADSDALAVLAGIQENLTPDALAQNVDPEALLALPEGIDPSQTLAEALGQISDPTNALTMMGNTAQNIAGDVLVCTPQAAIVIDTVECLLGAGTAGLPLTTADLRALAGSDLTLEGLLAQAQAMDPNITTVEELLAAPMTMEDALALIGGNLPAESDALGAITGLKDGMSAEALGQMIDLETLLPVPADALTSPMGALALVEGLAQQSTVVAEQCLKPEATIASLGSMLGTTETGLPLDPADLLMLSGTDITVNDLLSTAQSMNPAAETVADLLATPLDAGTFLNTLSAVLPAEAQQVLAGVTAALPADQQIALGDLLTLPSDVLPLDPMDTSLQDVLGTSTNLLAMMQMMAEYSDAQSAIDMLAGMATQQVVATVGKAGGMVLLGNLMSQMPSEETLTAVVPAELEGLVSTVLATEDPLSVVTTLLDTSLIGDVLEGLLGGDPLLEALTSLLGADLANELNTILDGLTTDPTATLETIQALLEGTLNDPTATTQTVQDLFGIDAGL
jgi:hypothetical protein